MERANLNVISQHQRNTSLNLSRQINGEMGYSIDLTLSDAELTTLRKMIRMQWLYRLQLLAPQHVHQFDQIGMERYHELAHLIDHSQAWPKYSRVLPREAHDYIRGMPFFKQLESEFGPIKVADEEKLGWENIYWRLVRPGTSDFGSLHADRWFVDLGYYGSEINETDYERVKIWIAIHTEVGKNGFLAVPRSHSKKDWKWHGEERYGQMKPVIDEDPAALDVTLLPTEPGRAVVFHYDLLHGGAPNLADHTRVSIEFTFLIKK